MGLLDRFEQSLDKLVNGAFAKAFKADVQPVEIAAALQKNMDERAAIVTRDRTVVPNEFTVRLAPSDYDRLSAYAEALTAELAGLARAHAEEQGFSFLGPVQVHLRNDDSLETGMLEVSSQAIASPRGATSVPATGTRRQPRPATAASRTPSPDTTAVSRPVAPPRRPPTARLLAAGQDIPLVDEVTVLGRGTDVSIRLEDPGVSRRHAEIHLLPTPEIIDLGSTNGTVVDGRRVTRGPLADGSVIRLGNTDLTFRSS